MPLHQPVKLSKQSIGPCDSPTRPIDVGRIDPAHENLRPHPAGLGSLEVHVPGAANTEIVSQVQRPLQAVRMGIEDGGFGDELLDGARVVGGSHSELRRTRVGEG